MELREFLIAEGISFDADAPKAQLASLAEHAPGLSASSLWARLQQNEEEARQKAEARRPKALYDLLMRTIQLAA